jgi:hypothetical protein
LHTGPIEEPVRICAPVFTMAPGPTHTGPTMVAFGMMTAFSAITMGPSVASSTTPARTTAFSPITTCSGRTICAPA